MHLFHRHIMLLLPRGALSLLWVCCLPGCAGAQTLPAAYERAAMRLLPAPCFRLQLPEPRLESYFMQKVEKNAVKPVLPATIHIPMPEFKLAFFCRLEHEWARRERLPLKFRLGSVEYVDWLEGKRW